MTCTKCKHDFSLNDIVFRQNGMVPNTQTKRYDAICADCIRSLPIDETSK